MNYAPYPQRGTNPLVYLLAGCGGCAILVLLFFFIMGIYISKKMGGPITQAVTAERFGEALTQHNYALAASYLSGPARQQYPPQKLAEKVQAFEKRYGPLHGIELDSQFQVDVHNSNSQKLFHLTDYIYELEFPHAMVRVKFHFEPNDPHHIAGIAWEGVYKTPPAEESPSSQGSFSTQQQHKTNGNY